MGACPSRSIGPPCVGIIWCRTFRNDRRRISLVGRESLQRRLGWPPSRLKTIRAGLLRVRQAVEADATRPLTRAEKVGLVVLVAVPMIVTAIALLPEVTIPVPSLNDDALHYLFVQRASQALANGQNPLDLWVPQIEAGFPQFFYYQPLPALVVAGLQRLSLGSVDLL